MKFKKLSIAAALSIGVMTISGLAIADQLSEVCPLPRAIQQPCPTGAAAPCPVCPSHQMIPQEPCPTGAAVPCVPAPVCGACPVVPAASPGLQHVYSPALVPPVQAEINPNGTALYNCPISGCTPETSAGARYVERQAYAYPDIGDAGLTIPRGDGILQIGGDEEAVAVCNTCPSGLTVIPGQGSVLTLASEDSAFGYTAPSIMGAAAPASCACQCPSAAAQAIVPPNYNPTAYPCPICAEKAKDEDIAIRMTQGSQILRCEIPEHSELMQAYFNSPCFRESGILGAAVPISPCPAPAPCAPCAPCSPCAPCGPCPTGQAVPLLPPQGTIAPVVPCNPCLPTGGAAPIYSNPCIPAIPLSSVEPADNIVPCANAAEDKELIPCDAFEPCPTGQAAPICPPAPVCPAPCPTGAAAPCPVQPCAPVLAPCPTGMAVPCGPINPCAPKPIGPRQIQTSSGIQMQKNVLVPVQVPVTLPCPTGSACPVSSQYPDVSNNMLAGCDINKLTAQGILAGYPDRTYKPNVPIMRDEFASAMVSALELENVPDFPQQIFKDVPNAHWANKDIDKAYNRGLMAGYPDCTFKPDRAVTRAEALSTMGKVIPGDITAIEAQGVLGCYTDSNEIPGWASLSVAEAVNAGIIKNLPQSDQIKPNQAASRAEVAAMLDDLRIVLGLEPIPVTTGSATQLHPAIAPATVPTLKVKFQDIISARTSTTGDEFIAKTTEPVSIDGVLFPEGSEVHGEVVEVIRPAFGQTGAIRVAFNTIKYECGDANGNGDGVYKTSLPRDILSAVVVKDDEPNIIGRVLAMPFSLPGKVAGVTGRTVGGMAITASNMTENFLTNTANGVNEIGSLEFPAAGRSFATAAGEIAEGVWFTGKTAVSGTLGVVKVSGDEVVYVVGGDGERIAQINPDEILSVAFAAK